MAKFGPALGKRRLKQYAATLAVSGLVAGISWKSNADFVRAFTEVHLNSSWKDWGFRWPGSFFVASPFFGKTADTLLATAQTALTFGLNERKEGALQTLRKAAVFHAAGCVATRGIAVSGLVAPADTGELDVGPSAGTAGMAAYILARGIREGETLRVKAMYAAGLTAVTGGVIAAAAMDRNVTDVVGHGAGMAAGIWSGTRKKRRPRSKYQGGSP